MRKLLLVDFDGVLCDSSTECLLVAWNAFLGRDTISQGIVGLESIPPGVAARFRHCRGFAKHVGHFIVPLWDTSNCLTTQDEFDAIYRTVPPSTLDGFARRVKSYRRTFRLQRTSEWLGHQGLYPGVRELLMEPTIPTFIVTAKDADSVVSVLEHHGVGFERQRIFGDLTDKIATFDHLESCEAIPKADMWYIDDRLLNVIDGKRAGVRALWATWGYQTPGDDAAARQSGVLGLSLRDFLGGPWRVGHETTLASAPRGG
jgi:phosphoglycolate phosphatase-like HAD superfamily hydrolase